jgi:ATP-dependent protease HslVU (ClpYQ) ATPase subunit
MSEEVRSAAAQAGMIDVELLIFEAAGAFHSAKTSDDLDAEWAKRVRPAYDQLSERALGILHHMYATNATLIQRGMR